MFFLKLKGPNSGEIIGVFDVVRGTSLLKI